MKAFALQEILDLHGKWRRGEAGGKRADLAFANLTDANLTDANLTDANLSHANLSRANLAFANLAHADLTDANLARANLSRANLARANLSRADLTDANLARADLTDTILSHANLAHADLTRARYDIRNILAMNIGTVSVELTLELMRWDATVCGQEPMTAWANGGGCPFSGNLQRPFRFAGASEIWKPGSPELNLMELWQTVTKEKSITI